jgi:hypothetical protein
MLLQLSIEWAASSGRFQLAAGVYGSSLTVSSQRRRLSTQSRNVRFFARCERGASPSRPLEKRTFLLYSSRNSHFAATGGR